jgi:hypothetical protein
MAGWSQTLSFSSASCVTDSNGDNGLTPRVVLRIGFHVIQKVDTVDVKSKRIEEILG